MKYSNGFIDLENENIKFKNNILTLNGKEYYAKKSGINGYGELIAYYLAGEMNILCTNYDVAYYMDSIYLICEKNDDVKSYDISFILSNYYYDINAHNNIKDIINSLKSFFIKRDVSSLEDELKRIYAFDILIANPDRNPTNLKVIDDGKSVHFAPLYDNENMLLNDDSIFDNDYTLKVNSSDENSLESFLQQYPDMASYLNDNVKLLDYKNIIYIFNNIEFKVKGVLPTNLKNKFIRKFDYNAKIINHVLDETKEKQKVNL